MLLNAACFSYCSILSCYHLSLLPLLFKQMASVGITADLIWCSYPFLTCSCSNRYLLGRPASCCFFGCVVLFFLNAEMNHIFLSEGESVVPVQMH